MNFRLFSYFKSAERKTSEHDQQFHVFRSGGLFVIAVLLASALSIPVLIQADQSREFYFFDVDLTSTGAGHTQIFFDVGKGINASDSSIQPLGVHHQKTTYRYMLPAKPIRALRFDPIDKEAILSISNARITDINGKVVATFPLSDWTAFHQIASMESHGDILQITTSEAANDPMMVIRLAEPVQLKIGWDLKARIAAPVWIPVFVFVYVLAILFYRLPLSRWSGRIKLGDKHPIATLAIVSLVAVCIQCHPVIFFGKSFVSPNNGTSFYYGTFPTLPGSFEKEVEDSKGSDVAAMLSQSLYYPSLQREAIFKHGELPLWDRYTMCGLPLLGQGQSMFGSVLNLIPLIGDSSSRAWDARYIAGRWLFGLGLGLVVWLATRCLRSAIAVAFIGIFAGFFVFRLNHMAQFSAEAAPWILVGWILLRDAVTWRARSTGALLLMVGNWEVFTSGTVKEACTLILCANLVGLLSVLIASIPWRRRITALSVAVFTGFIFLLISAPILVSFIRAIRSSYTVSDIPAVYQIPGWLFLGLFDDFFYGRLNNDSRVLPSSNLIIYLGAAWALVGFRQNIKDRFFTSLLIVVTLAAFVVFSVIPRQWLLQVPLLRNIGHVHNTFSCAMVVLFPIVAGFGFRSLLSSAVSRYWQRDCLLAVAIMAVPVYYYFKSSWMVQGSPFFEGYITAILLASLMVYAAITSWRRNAQTPILLAALSAACALIVWRQGQYLKTPIDDYVFNPRERVDFRVPSPSIELISQKVAQEPSRPAGLHMNLFCGYNQMLNWESIFGVEAVRSFNYDKLLAMGGVNKLLWGAPETLISLGGKPGEWHDDDVDFILPLQNMLGVRYYLETSSSPAPSAELHRIASLDVDIYESEQAWPRAFFTESITVYTDVRQLIAKLRRADSRKPFAAIDLADAAIIGTGVPKTTSLAQPASDYKLTSNRTAFTVNATGAGFAVLIENYFPEDFRAYINDEEVPYYRMNHSFKGVRIPGPGTYEIRFEYWPRYLTAALWACGSGLLLGLAAVYFAYRPISLRRIE